MRPEWWRVNRVAKQITVVPQCNVDGILPRARRVHRDHGHTGHIIDADIVRHQSVARLPPAVNGLAAAIDHVAGHLVLVELKVGFDRSFGRHHEGLFPRFRQLQIYIRRGSNRRSLRGV